MRFLSHFTPSEWLDVLMRSADSIFPKGSPVQKPAWNDLKLPRPFAWRGPTAHSTIVCMNGKQLWRLWAHPFGQTAFFFWPSKGHFALIPASTRWNYREGLLIWCLIASVSVCIPRRLQDGMHVEIPGAGKGYSGYKADNAVAGDALNNSDFGLLEGLLNLIASN